MDEGDVEVGIRKSVQTGKKQGCREAGNKVGVNVPNACLLT